MPSTTRSSKQKFRRWGILSLTVSVVVVVSSVVGAFLLDMLTVRPVIDGGSITTLLPGSVYGSVLVMKVCIGQALVMLFAGLGFHFLSRRPASESPFPIWSVVSLMIPPLVPLGMAIGVLMLQALTDYPDGVSSMGTFRQLSRSGVFIMIGMLSVAALASVCGILRREKPRGLALIGLITNVFLLAVFRYWEFYKLGFDQDRWNDIG
jgi:hypothetical protein